MTQSRWGGKWVHLAYIWIVPHLCAKNYRNWWKFDEVLTKTNLLSFFGTRCSVRRLAVAKRPCDCSYLIFARSASAVIPSEKSSINTISTSGEELQTVWFKFYDWTLNTLTASRYLYLHVINITRTHTPFLKIVDYNFHQSLWLANLCKVRWVW